MNRWIEYTNPDGHRGRIRAAAVHAAIPGRGVDEGTTLIIVAGGIIKAVESPEFLTLLVDEALDGPAAPEPEKAGA